MKTFLALLLLFFIQFTSISTQNEDSTVELKLGKVVGTVIKADVVDYYKRTTGKDVQSVHQFIGVPFAEPPVKELRFKKPNPVKPWKPNDLIAKHLSPSCLQQAFLPEFFGQQLNQSEDCLYLNIWTPSLPKSGDTTLKPVFVWIHGGGFELGSGNQDMYHGAILSSTQDIVVVVINYRLGPLGFLVSKDTDHAPGNVGLWDQVMALEFVQDHIKYFGGNPDSVTIAGESAGSMSVSSLFLSPRVDNLFRNIITMSGSSLITNTFRHKDVEFEKTKKLAQVVNCPVDDEQSMMKCLIEIDAEKLIISDDSIKKTFPFQKEFIPATMLFTAVTGDELLPEKTIKLIKKLANKSKVRVLSGVTNYEGGLINLINLAKNKSSLADGVEDDSSDAFELINNWLINDLNFEEKDAKLITSTYLNGNKLLTTNNEAINDIFGDYYLLCPSFYENELIFEKVNQVFQYVFTYKSVKNEMIEQLCPGKGLVCHGQELPFVFGVNLLKQTEQFNDDNDFEQAIQTMNVIGSFVRNEKMVIKRNINGKYVNQDWKTYDLVDKVSLNFNHLKNNRINYNYKSSDCNLFKKYIIKH